MWSRSPGGLRPLRSPDPDWSRPRIRSSDAAGFSAGALVTCRWRIGSRPQRRLNEPVTAVISERPQIRIGRQV